MADGRPDWVGWLELKTQAVTELAVRHTAQVVHDVGADVLGVVEAESRIALQRFNVDLLRPISDRIYGHIMLIDGNDDRGIDVGVMTRGDHPIERIVSHVDDADLAGPDLRPGLPRVHRHPAQRRAAPRAGQPLQVQGLRRRRPTPTGAASGRPSGSREIYRARRAEGVEHIVVLGDLNDTPDSAPARAPARRLGRRTDRPARHRDPPGLRRRRVARAPTRPAGPATRSTTCSAPPPSSPGHRRRGIFRKGVWTAVGRWEMYPTLTREQDAASDHAAIWADVDL